jgi:hypothetical protein
LILQEKVLSGIGRRLLIPVTVVLRNLAESIT